MKLLHYIKASAALLFLLTGLTAAAQSSIVQPLAANVVSNYLAGKYIISAIRVTNSSTNAATIKFYDWATATTNVVRPAYQTVVGYSTNYNVVYTNSAGIVATNTFSGWFTDIQTVAEATNEQTRLGEFQIPASTTRDLPFYPVVARGFTALSSAAGTIELVYSTIP